MTVKVVPKTAKSLSDLSVVLIKDFEEPVVMSALEREIVRLNNAKSWINELFVMFLTSDHSSMRLITYRKVNEITLQAFGVITGKYTHSDITSLFLTIYKYMVDKLDCGVELTKMLNGLSIHHIFPFTDKQPKESVIKYAGDMLNSFTVTDDSVQFYGQS